MFLQFPEPALGRTRSTPKNSVRVTESFGIGITGETPGRKRATRNQNARTLDPAQTLVLTGKNTETQAKRRATDGAGIVGGMEINLSQDAWEQFQRSLHEHDDRLERRVDGQTYPRDEQVDVWVLSAHAEAIFSQDIDPEVWETLADLDMEAETEEDAWRLIRSFYLERGNVLVRIGEGATNGGATAEGAGPDDREEWIFSEALATRLGLAGFAQS